MFLTAKPFEQGKFSVILGPVNSDKKRIVNSFLDAAVDSGYKTDQNIIVFRHPDDDQDPEHIGRHQVKVTDQVDQIHENILPQTRTVMIVGASHYKDKKIIDLADAITRSNRDLIVSGLNLDHQGRPHGHMPDLISLANEIHLAKAICSHPDCQNREANRSRKTNDHYSSVCTHHYHFSDSPPVSRDCQGFLKFDLGSMFSGKTTNWADYRKSIKKTDLEVVTFMYLHDARYGEEEKQIFEEGNITLHSEVKIPAVPIKEASHIEKYLTDHPQIKYIFINEAQFIRHLYPLLSKLIPQGYRFYLDGLLRDIKRKKFNQIPKPLDPSHPDFDPENPDHVGPSHPKFKPEKFYGIPELVCLADKVNMYYATCVQCGHPASENQRMKRIHGKVKPAHFQDPVELIGGQDEEGAEYFYQARCLEHWLLDGEPELLYQFPKFSWQQLL